MPRANPPALGWNTLCAVPFENPSVSVIVPAYNEEKTIGPLIEKIRGELLPFYSLQIICVDDGSTDGTWAHIARQADAHAGVEGVRLRRNFGKSAALQAGLDRCTGDLVVTIDADLQDDPSEIRPMLELLEREGLDLVAGWKKNRHDSLEKRLASKLFNGVARRISGTRLQDHNCGLKCFTRAVAGELRLYGELHRFIPALVASRGYRLGEKPVRHFPREHGSSKYGKSRLYQGLLDSITVTLITKFRSKPLHLIGGFGLLPAFAGLGGLTYLAASWFAGARPIGTRPLLFYSIAALVVGVQILCTGMVAELISATLFERESPYAIREVHSGKVRKALPTTTPKTPDQPLDC